MDKILQKLDNKVTYMAVTIAALGLSALVLALILMSGDAAAASGSNATIPQQVIVTPPTVTSRLDADTLAVIDTEAVDKLPLTIEVTDQTAAGLIRAALSEKIATESLSVAFLEPDSMKISAVFTKQALSDFLEDEGVPLTGLVLFIAPEQLQLDMELSVATDADGRLKVQARDIVTNGFQLSAHLPDGIVDMANNALQSALPESTALGGLTIENGRVVFTLLV